MGRDYDLFVIGGGSGGVRAARVAGAHGARVAIAEEHRYGGTCVIRGCVPKKLFVYASEISALLEDAAGFGWNAQGWLDWPTLRRNKDAAIERLEGIYAELLDRAGVQVLHGRAVLEDPHTVRVGDQTFSADTILVSTGATPERPPIHGIEHSITSNELFDLPELPRHAVIVGGGYIGVELAHILRGFGCKVHLVHRRELVLRGFDHDIREAVTAGLRARHIELTMSHEVTDIEKLPSGQLEVFLTGGERLQTDLVLFATGRIPNTLDTGLAEAGVKLGERGAVIVDEYSRSSVDHIYAVGDVTDRVPLTPVAIREGQAFADTVYGGKPTPVDHVAVPSAVFCQPPAATVGLTEAQAAEIHGEVHVYRARFRPLRHSLSGRDEQVLMKLIVHPDTDRILGAHMVGEHADEQIQCLAVAVKMGVTKAQLDSTTALHPTVAEEWVLMRTRS